MGAIHLQPVGTVLFREGEVPTEPILRAERISGQFEFFGSAGALALPKIASTQNGAIRLLVAPELGHHL